MKRIFKGKKVELPAQPRSLDDIKKELGEVLVQIGNAQYQVSVYTEDVQRFSRRAKELNQEGAKRIELDDAAKKAQEATNV